MTVVANEDAQMSSSHRAPEPAQPNGAPGGAVVQRWRDLRQMLIRQLDMFETGGLRLHADRMDVSSSAIADLKSSILEFDALLSAEADRIAGR